MVPASSRVAAVGQLVRPASRSIIFMVFLAIAALARGAAGVAASSNQTTKLPAQVIPSEIRSLLDDSGSLPPEFQADVRLRIVEAGLIRDAGAQMKILIQAYDVASAVQDDLMRRPWGENVEETVDGLHAMASMIGRLDRTSLQTRAVRQILLLVPEQGKRVFQSMPPPRLEPLQCNANSYFVPDSYYEALGAVAERGFSPSEIADGHRAAFVESAVKGIQFHVQLVPVARMLIHAQLSAQEIQELILSYAAALNGVGDDPGSFAIFTSEPGALLDAMTELVSFLKAKSVASFALLQALRAYLVANLKAESCGSQEHADDSGSVFPAMALQFNKKFATELTRTNLGPIRLDEIKGDGKRSEPAPPSARWKSQTYSQLLLAVQGLNSREDEVAKWKTDPAWLSLAEELLQQLNAWSDTSEPETEFFHQKALLLEGLAEKTIGTPLGARAMSAFVRFLEQYSYQQVGAITWFLHAKLFLTRAVAKGDAGSGIEAFLTSRDPVLRTYARLELLQAKHGAE